MIASRLILIRTWGRPESEVHEILDDLYTSSVNPSLAFSHRIRRSRSGHGQGRYRGRGPSLIEPMETEVRSRLGDSVFGLDDETIERVLMQLLSDRGYTVGTAESMTGGMVSA